MLALFRVYDPVEFGQQQVEPGDVEEPLTTLSTACTTVRDADGRLVGYSHLAADGQAESLVEPGRADLHRALLAALVVDADRRGTGPLVHWSGPGPDSLAAGPLTDAGFVHRRTAWRLERDTSLPAPPPSWPDGVVARPFDRVRDVAELHDLVQRSFAGTFGSRPRPLAQWVRESFDERYDALCVEQDGALVAAATVTERTAGGLAEGYVGALAVAPEHRGRGLAKGLLHAVFRRDAAAGRLRMSLHADGENATAVRLYAAVGMQVVEELRRWERDVAT